MSFPVRSCRIQCTVTFADKNHDKQFAQAFHVERKGKSCLCLGRGGETVLKFRHDSGNCDDSMAKARCFHDYKVLRTNEYVREYKRETTRIVRHFELFHERKFDYSMCEENACQGGDCFDSEFPSIMEGRSAEEKNVIADILHKEILKKNMDKDDLTEDEHALIIDQLNAEDIATILGKTGDAVEILASISEELEEESEPDEADALYAEVLEEAGESLLTVSMLRKIYKLRLKGTAISAEHLLTVAGLTEDEQVVDFEGFKRFVRPQC